MAIPFKLENLQAIIGSIGKENVGRILALHYRIDGECVAFRPIRNLYDGSPQFQIEFDKPPLDHSIRSKAQALLELYNEPLRDAVVKAAVPEFYERATTLMNAVTGYSSRSTAVIKDTELFNIIKEHNERESKHISGIFCKDRPGLDRT